MSKVTLVFPCLEAHKDYHYVPLSSLTVAAPLEAAGIACAIFDERVEPLEALWDKLADAKVLGITIFSGYQTHRAYHLLRAVRERNKNLTIVAGGPHVTNMAEAMLQSDLIDYTITGYGEESFYALARHLLGEGDQDPQAIPGVGWKDADGLPHLNPARPRFPEAFWHPLPYHRVDISKYLNPATQRVMYVTTYGCPGKCTFCATPAQRHHLRRPLPLVRADISALRQRVGVRQIVFFDATLFTSKPRLAELLGFLDTVPEATWIADSRADEIITYSDAELEKIKHAGGGLVRLVVGLESGSRRIAETVMRKGKDHLDKFAECARRLDGHGISLVSGLIFGVPGETADDVRDTTAYVSRIRDLDPDFRLSSTFFRPLPGTELHAVLERRGHRLPHSFEEWAVYGETNHYRYNEWMDIPWMPEAERDAYRRAYEGFVALHGSIFI